MSEGTAHSAEAGSASPTSVDEMVEKRIAAEDAAREKRSKDRGKRTRSITVDFFERGAPVVTFWGKFDGHRTSVAMNAIGKAFRRRSGRRTFEELMAREAAMEKFDQNVAAERPRRRRNG